MSFFDNSQAGMMSGGVTSLGPLVNPMAGMNPMGGMTGMPGMGYGPAMTAADTRCCQGPMGAMMPGSTDMTMQLMMMQQQVMMMMMQLLLGLMSGRPGAGMNPLGAGGLGQAGALGAPGAAGIGGGGGGTGAANAGGGGGGGGAQQAGGTGAAGAAGAAPNVGHRAPSGASIKGVDPVASDALRRAGLSEADVSQGLGHAAASEADVSQGLGHAAASAGTHEAEPGSKYTAAVDIRTSGRSQKEIESILSRLRAQGFAAWYRHGGTWSGNEHIHAVYAGIPLKASLESQVKDFIAGRTGLVGHAAETGYFSSNAQEEQTVAALFAQRQNRVSVT